MGIEKCDLRYAYLKSGNRESAAILDDEMTCSLKSDYAAEYLL